MTAALAEAEAPAEEPGKPICGVEHPTQKSVICTREPHKGGHLRAQGCIYWPADEAS